MKQKIIILMAGILMLASCSNREDVQADDVVTLRFQTWDMKIDPMTRSGLNLADFATHLDIWVVNGTDVQQVHQVSTQAGYGTVQLTLNKTKTYTLYAVAHRCTEAASLSEGIVSFPDEKVTQSFFATATLTPATSTSQDVTLNRIVGMFRLETTDAVPDNVTKFQLSVPQAYTRWNVSGSGANHTDRVSTINISNKNNDGSVSLNLYIIPSSLTATDTYDITVSALTATDDVVETKVFQDVQIKANYKTVYSGMFFTTSAMQVSFDLLDWQTFSTVEF